MTGQERIGYFIKNLRKRKGLTQKDFALRLKTSQSAVARMEAGKQNLTTKELSRISEALEHKILSIDTSTDFRIKGGRKLSGSVITQTSKNGAMGLMCASLVNKGKTTLHGIPRIEEVYRLIEILQSIGVSVNWSGDHTLEIRPPKNFSISNILYTYATKVRSSLMLIGALIHNKSSFTIPHAGGCKMGERTIAAHRYGLEELGVNIKTTNSNYLITHKSLKPADIVLYEASETANENLLIAASKIPGKTTLRFAPPNYQVQDVCRFLGKLGVKIEGIGTTNMVIHGVSDINCDVEYYNSEDPTESMMFIGAAVVTHSKLLIKRCPIDFLSLEFRKLEKMGLKIKKSKVLIYQIQLLWYFTILIV